MGARFWKRAVPTFFFVTFFALGVVYAKTYKKSFTGVGSAPSGENAACMAAKNNAESNAIAACGFEDEEVDREMGECMCTCAPPAKDNPNVQFCNCRVTLKITCESKEE